MDKKNHHFPNTPKYFYPELEEFIYKLRKYVFKYTTAAAKSIYSSHTTVGRYEKPNSGIRAPLGYIAYLSIEFVEKHNDNSELIQERLLKEIKQVVRHHYPETEPFKSWESLANLANNYMEERRLAHGSKQGSNTQDTTLNSSTSIERIGKWLGEFFKWEEADEHMHSSWAGKLIWSLNILFSHMTLDRWKNLIIIILLLILASYSLTPILQWPLDNLEIRKNIVIKYAFGSLFLPFLVGILSKPDPNKFKIKTRKHRFIVLVLKLAGAFTGFHAFFLLVLIFVSTSYYLWEITYSGWFIGVLVMFPLLFSHIGARRIPADRYKMFGEKPQLHQADLLFLGVFFFFGAFFSFFFHLFYSQITKPVTGFYVLFAILIIIFIENYKKNKKLSISTATGFFAGILGVLFIALVIYSQSIRGWYIRVDKTDDINALIIDNHIYGVYVAGTKPKWVKIPNNAKENTEFYFVNLNGSGPGRWEFSLRHDGTIIGGDKEHTDNEFSLGAVQLWKLHSNGTPDVEDIPVLGTRQREAKWVIDISANDVGFVLVNGVPVAGAYPSQNGDFSFFDISKYISDYENVRIDILIWNTEGPYSWDIALFNDGKEIWRSQESGFNEAGEIHAETVFLSNGTFER